jgi:hypothetical protein
MKPTRQPKGDRIMTHPPAASPACFPRYLDMPLDQPFSIDALCGAISEEITCVVGLLVLLSDRAGEIERADTPDEGSRGALEASVLTAFTGLRELRERLQSASDRLQAAHRHANETLEEARTTVECIIHDHLDPSLTALRTLRDRITPEVPA